MTRLVEELERVNRASRKYLERIFPKFEFPREIELMDKLNKANRDKYEHWLYMRKITDKILGKKIDYAV